MATAGRSTLLAASIPVNNSTADTQNQEEEDGQNLWSSILSEVSTRSRSKLPCGKNVLVLGEFLRVLRLLRPLTVCDAR
ncbi:hypothetical protein PDJAM_G00261530 [Pangasius djambal]|nr:hypothetical protein [Pangasius djambal]